MTYTLEEQETHIYYDAVERKWYIETTYAPHIARLLKQNVHKEDPNSVVTLDEKIDKVVYIKTAVNEDEYNIRPFPKKKRKLSDEKKQLLVDRLQKGKKNEEN